MKDKKTVILISVNGEREFSAEQAAKILAKSNGGGWRLKEKNGSASSGNKGNIKKSDKQGKAKGSGDA